MSEFSNLSSIESKSPVEIDTLIFRPRLIFSNDKVESNENKNQSYAIHYYKKIIKPNVEEITKHKDFLKKELKKNFY